MEFELHAGVTDLMDKATESAVLAVIAAGHAASARNWIPATSGNFSVRIDDAHIAITRSGVDKGALTSADVLIQPLHQKLVPNSSAEAALHLRLYEDHSDIGAVFHVHSHYATVIAQAHLELGTVRLAGWELQKALDGINTHTAVMDVPVFANDQDVAALSDRVAGELAAPLPSGYNRAPGYLIAGHGLYAWGRGADDAARHVEAFECLFHQTMTLKMYRP